MSVFLVSIVCLAPVKYVTLSLREFHPDEIASGFHWASGVNFSGLSSLFGWYGLFGQFGLFGLSGPS